MRRPGNRLSVESSRAWLAVYACPAALPGASPGAPASSPALQSLSEGTPALPGVFMLQCRHREKQGPHGLLTGFNQHGRPHAPGIEECSPSASWSHPLHWIHANGAVRRIGRAVTIRALSFPCVEECAMSVKV